MADILVVEDNREFAAALRYNLEMEGYRVVVAPDGLAALTSAREHRPDLMVLDLMLPGLDGYAVLETLRREGFEGPVLILSARGEEADKVRGFRAGADQYVTKPVGLLELLERVKLLLRRHGRAGPARETLRFGDIEVDPGARVVRRKGEPVALTPRAFDLLVVLIRRDGAVATRVELMREVWGHRAAVMSRTVDAHVKELRRKLEDDPAHPRHILTAWKAGYRFEP